MNIEDRLRDELGRAAGGPAEPPNWAAIRDRAFARRRRRRALAYPLVGLVAVALIVGSVVAVASVRNGNDGSSSVTAGPTNAAPPQQIVAVTADGRLVVLETSSGRELRTLAEGATATLGGGDALATAPDGRAVFFTRNATSSTCPGTPDTEIARIDLSTGAIESVASDAQYPLLTLSPDGRLLAYPPAKSCLDAGRSIVVVDLVTGARTEFTADVGSIINFLSWAPDARHLTYTLFDSPGNGPRVVDTEIETRLDEPRAIPNPDGSRIRQYLGQTGLFVGTQQPPISNESQGVGVVTFDSTSGAIERTLFRLPEASSPQTVASDPTGRHVLATGGIALYRWSEDDTRPTKIADGIIAAAWLPDRGTPTPEPEPRPEVKFPCGSEVPFRPTYLPAGFRAEPVPGMAPITRYEQAGASSSSPAVTHYTNGADRFIEIHHPGTPFLEILGRDGDFPNVEVLGTGGTLAPIAPTRSQPLVVQFNLAAELPAGECDRWSLDGYGVTEAELAAFAGSLVPVP